jgi:glycosyl transferase, family 25
MSKYIDAIIYINLDDRPDKKEYMESQLNALGVTYERFSGIYQKKNGVGCTKSHLAVQKLARERGYKNVLILEDDFTFSVTKEDFERKLTELFETGPVFDVCFLSNTTIEKDEPIEGCSFLNRAIDVYGAEAYIVQNHYYDAIISTYEIASQKLEETGMHWHYTADRAWVPLLQSDRWYRFVERFGKQNRDLVHDNI